MVAPRTDEKHLPVAGIPGKSPWWVPDITHSITAHCLVANRLATRYLKSGPAAKAPVAKRRTPPLPRATTPKVTSSKTQLSVKREAPFDRVSSLTRLRQAGRSRIGVA